MTQPEALRLADELSKSHLNHYVNHAAAAELRRLHSKIIDLEESVRILLTVVSERDRIEAQRDALLAALERSRAQWIHSVNADYCLSAIAKAEKP